MRKRHLVKPLLVITGIFAFNMLCAVTAHSQNTENSGEGRVNQDATETTGYYVIKPNDCFQPNFKGERKTHMLMDKKTGRGRVLDVTGLDMAKIKTGRQVTVRGSTKTQEATPENPRQRKVFKATSIKLAEAQSATSEPEPAITDETPSTSEGATAPPEKSGAVSVTNFKCLLLFANTGDYTVNATKKAASENFLFGAGGNVSDAFYDSTYGHYRLTQGDSVVLDLTSETAAGTTSEDMRALMHAKAASLGYYMYTDNPDEYQRIFFFMPNGVTDGVGTNWTAWAYIDSIGGSWGHSVYSYNWTGAYFDGHAHENSHNCGLQHSSEGTKEYGDETGVMGYSHSSSSKDAISTLNPVKKAQLGVYDSYPGSKIDLSVDDTLDMYPLAISPSVQAGARCVTFAGKDYYISYRRNILPYGKIWSNDSTKIDKIVVYTNTDFGSRSFLVGTISEGGTYNADGVAIKFERYGDVGKNYATVSFDLVNDNTKPVANAQSPNVAMNTPTGVTLTGSDADSGDTLTYSVVTNPSNGSLSGTAPNVTYTPNADYTGADSFVFKIDDGNISSFATVSITVSLSGYIVSYDGNGSTGGAAPSDQNKTQGVGLVLATNSGNLVKSGSTFVGWNTAANGTGTDYAEGATYGADANLALYAKWTTLPTYTVNYNGNGNTGGSAPSNQAKVEDINLTLATEGTLVKTGYVFTGWNTVAGGGGTPYAASGTYSSNAALALYAQWAAASYTVTFDGNGGGSPSPTSKTATYDSSYGALATVSRTGYALSGWFTQASGGTEVQTSTTVATDSNHTLYAQWTANNYTVIFNANGGGTPSPGSKSVTYGSTYGTLSATSRAGYTFIGWFTSGAGGSEITAGDSVAITATQTLYAHWNAKPVVSAGTDQTVYMTGSDVDWTPADAAKLAWYDAGDASSITQNSGAVSQWNDKSGNGYHMKQINGTSQPVYSSSDSLFGGRPSISTGPSYKYLTMDQTIAVKRMYMITYYGDGTQTSWTNHNALVGSSDGSIRLTGRSNGNKVFDGSGDAKNFDNGGTTYRNGSTANTTQQANGLPINGEIFTVTSSSAKTAQWRLLGNNANYTLWDGGLGEMIFTDGTESLETQQMIEGYLAWKWGMQAKLSAAHPYSTANATSGPKKSVPSATATLAGTVTDSDDTPSVTWSDTGTGDGTGTVTFVNANSLDTDVSFSGTGTYILQLTANDGHVEVGDVVEITVNAPTTYGTWISGYSIGGSTGLNDNSDGDGLNNLQEYAFGLDPTSAVTTSLAYSESGEVTQLGLPVHSENSGSPLAVYSRRKDYNAVGLIYSVWFSADLQVWTNSPAAHTPLPSSGDYQAVSVPYPLTVPVTGGGAEQAPNFFRVGIDTN